MTTYAQDEWTRNAIVQRQDTTGKGRWPANLLLDEEAAMMLDEQSGELHSQDPKTRCNTVKGAFFGSGLGLNFGGYGDTGGASRFFYTAKASRSERGEGNDHPTVKPLALMRWLCRLVTPPGGLILDPFMGSGTTALAAILEGFRFVGVEQDEHYCDIAVHRLKGKLLPLDEEVQQIALLAGSEQAIG